MSKFKAGDKVKILDGAKIENYTASWAMDQYVGEVHKVKDVDAHWIDGRVSYMLDGCGCYKFDERGLALVTKQENKFKFKVGDKVIGNEKANKYGITTEGWIGTVTEVLDEPRGGDDFKAFGPGIDDGKSTFTLNSNYFDLYTNTQKIVITTDGKTTTAVLYDGKKRIKDAKAVCAPTDKFDFNYGASLALDRLTGFVRGQVDQTLEVNSDWDKFIAGEIAFEMTSDKYDAFLNEVEKRFPGLRWCGGEKSTEWKPSYKSSCYFKTDYNGRLFWGTSSPTERVPWTGKPGLDWKKFATGKLAVKVNKEKYEEFMKLCEEKNFKWADGVFATKMNPWELYDHMPAFLKILISVTDDMPSEYIYVSFASDKDELKWGNKPSKDCDIYEFV